MLHVDFTEREYKMKYNLLGNSGLKVSNLSIGTMNYGKGDPSQPFFRLG